MKIDITDMISECNNAQDYYERGQLRLHEAQSASESTLLFSAWDDFCQATVLEPFEVQFHEAKNDLLGDVLTAIKAIWKAFQPTDFGRLSEIGLKYDQILLSTGSPAALRDKISFEIRMSQLASTDAVQSAIFNKAKQSYEAAKQVIGDDEELKAVFEKQPPKQPNTNQLSESLQALRSRWQTVTLIDLEKAEPIDKGYRRLIRDHGEGETLVMEMGEFYLFLAGFVGPEHKFFNATLARARKCFTDCLEKNPSDYKIIELLNKCG